MVLKILLDIDGVMVPEKPWQIPNILDDDFFEFTKNSIYTLNKILEIEESTIILTTSHKHKFDLYKWLEIFQNRGINIFEIERLETNTIQIGRNKEIELWYKNNKDEKFIIIDDNKSLFDLPKEITKRLIITNSFTGLREEMLEDIYKKINI
jgi:hypothetical protein